MSVAVFLCRESTNLKNRVKNHEKKCANPGSTLTGATLVCLIIVASWGCQSIPRQTSDPALAITQSEQEILLMLDRAASSPADLAASLFYQAAAAYADLAREREAIAAFARIEPGWLARSELANYQLLNAQIALFNNDPGSAERLLAGLAENLPATSGTPLDRRRYDWVQGQLCAAQGAYVCAANRLINANPGPAFPYNDLIWSYMGRASGYAVAYQGENGRSIATGWWQLKAQLLHSHSAREQQRAFATWRAEWRDHPASQRLPLALQNITSEVWQPQHIGLMLPLSGGLRRAGRAVRDGFVAAYLAANADSQDRPGADLQVSFYDTQSQPMAQLYERVLTDGVDLLIGPLQKELVTRLNSLNPEIPTLVLNYLEPSDVPAANLLQLGLAIEDEARTIGQRMQADGIESLLLLHTYEEWSLRAKRQLERQWTGPVTVQSFTDLRTVTESVGTAMNVAASLARKQELNAAFKFDLEFLPRARGDLDGIVALVNNVEANALVPALRFHFANNLPVYATSQVVRGARPAQLSELANFRVSELPWYLFDDPLYQAIDESFGLAANPFSSLYALGADALRVSNTIALLDRSATTQMLGSTGVLSLTADGRFRRELTWGVIRRSTVQAMPFVSH